MDKKIYLVTVVLCGLLLAANLFYLYSNRPSEEDAINKELADKDRMAAYNLDQLQTICIQQLQTENVQLDENIYLFEENGDSVQMQEVLGRKDKFVIRFNDAGCTSCIEEFIRKLPLMKNFIQEIGVENIVVFLNTTNPRNVTVFKKQHKLDCPVYALPIGELDAPIEKQDEIVAYYYFVFSDSGMMENCFIPIRGLEERNDVYLNSIRRKFQKN